jgi:hypothetical protein
MFTRSGLGLRGFEVVVWPGWSGWVSGCGDFGLLGVG